MYKYIRIYTLTLLVFMGMNLPAIASAQEDENSLIAGTWALQFQLSNSTDLGPFSASNLTFKRQFSNKKALAFEVTFSGETRKQDEKKVSYGREPSEADYEKFTHHFSLSAFYLYYPRPETKLNLFLGAGPVFAISFSNQNNINLQIEGKGRMYSAGIVALAGAEWFVRKNVSLLTGFKFGARYQYQKATGKTTGETNLPINESVIKYLSVSGYSALFGAAFYF